MGACWNCPCRTHQAEPFTFPHYAATGMPCRHTSTNHPQDYLFCPSICGDVTGGLKHIPLAHPHRLFASLSHIPTAFPRPSLTSPPLSPIPTVFLGSGGFLRQPD